MNAVMIRCAVALCLIAAPAAAGGQTPTVTPPAVAPWRVDPFPSTYHPRPNPPLLIRHATVLDGVGGRLDDGDILLRDGKVAAVGKALPAEAGVREINAAGRWVTPGVIDVHSHDGTYVLPLTTIDREAGDVSENSDLNSADTWIETAVNPQDTAFSRALRGGVTTIQILPGSSPIFSGRSVVVRPVPATTVAAMKFEGGVQGFKMSCGENPKEQGADTHRGPTSRQGTVAFMRRAFLDAQDYRRDWEAGKNPKRDLKREALAGVLAGDLRVNMHCYRADDMATMVSLSHEFGFRIGAFHHAVEAYKIPDVLREAGVCSAVWGDWWGFKMEAQDAVRANAVLLDRAGACVMMHSDSPGSGQRLTIEAAKAMGAGRRAGINVPPERAIRWVTSQPAGLLGLEKRIGALTPGYDANVVLWSGNPFSIYTKADLVLIDGAPLYDRKAPSGLPVSDFELGRRAVEDK